VNTPDVVIAKERVLCKYGFEPKRLCCHHYTVLYNACALVPMNDVNLFADENLSYKGQAIKKTQKCYVSLANRHLGQVVHFKSVSHVSHATSIILKLVSHKTYFMSSFNQALGQLIAVGLNSTKLGEGEVSADQNAVLARSHLFVIR